MRGRTAPPHPGIYRVPPPPPGRFTSWMAREILNFNSVRYRKSNIIIQEFWERFLSNVVSWNEFVHRLMSHSVWNHIACLYYILTGESKWLNSCISLKIKKYFKSHHVLSFFRCYFHFFCSLCINYDLQNEKKGWRTKMLRMYSNHNKWQAAIYGSTVWEAAGCTTQHQNQRILIEHKFTLHMHLHNLQRKRFLNISVFSPFPSWSFIGVHA